MMKLYHGSDIEVSRPLVNIGRKELDFGPGFYVTSLYEQSIKWARRVSVVRNVVPPIVNVYSFDLDRCLSDHYRRLSLPHYDRQWLDFVVASRRGEQPWADYDMIEGGIANDDVIDTVEDYYSGRITVDQALGLLKFARPTHQLCINKQGIIDNYLTFIQSERI